ncbi:putative GTP-binding protein 6 [Microplitis demolitor]|uniref:putative GTP-binding protein 6 n=1 Tax=Microplitis demolitor TaxID=69319 RepID=UPI0004CCAF5D|nr:putative GTP-binding protein 6 [Microplitis demolitor]
MHLLKNIKQTSQFILSNYKKLLNCNHKLNSICIKRLIHDYEHESIDEDPTVNREYADLTKQYLNPAQHGHGTLILQPYIKWGADKKRNTTPQLQLAEAEALIRTLPRWSVVDSLCISLMTLKKKKLLGKGNLKMLEERVKHNPKITALFVSVNLLRPVQINELQDLLGVPVYDRYSIVIQIFREHAKTPEAKLQVALAELPYIWKKLTWTTEDSGGRINLSEKRKLILHARESKLRNALSKLKEHRKLIRSNRSSKKIPSVAIVGYTNSGKTCLIKALTGDQSLMPQNKLFATLDTTAHEGLLPCRLKVLYMDTIGFIQDIPEGLIEPFVATFEDAIIADVIVHVYDASHPDKDAQIEHVRETLDKIMTELETPDKPIIEIANKCDVAPTGAVPDNVLAISALKLTGIDLLRRQIEKHILEVTGRKSLKIRVLSGSNIAAWLYKETTVTDTEADLNNLQYMFITSLVTDQQMHRFKKFIKEQSAS